MGSHFENYPCVLVRPYTSVSDSVSKSVNIRLYDFEAFIAQLGALCCNWVSSKYQEVESSHLVTDYKHNFSLLN